MQCPVPGVLCRSFSSSPLKYQHPSVWVGCVGVRRRLPALLPGAEEGTATPIVLASLDQIPSRHRQPHIVKSLSHSRHQVTLRTHHGRGRRRQGGGAGRG
eukprot:3308219-Rhodomonas_salina.2